MSRSGLLFLLLLLLPGVVRGAEADFVIESSPGARRHEATVRRLLQRSAEQVGTRLGLSLGGPVRIEVAAERGDFDTRVRNRTGSTPPEWALAIAQSDLGLIVIDGSRIRTHENNLIVTLKHELAHIALGRMQRRAHRRIPRWAEEGMAEWVGGGLLAQQALQKLRVAAREGQLLPFSRLRHGFPAHHDSASLAYIQAHHILIFFVQTHGAEALRALLSTMEEGTSFAQAMQEVAGRGPVELERAWRESLTSGSNVLLSIVEQLGLFGLIGLLFLVAVVCMKIRARRMLEEMDE